MVRLSISSGSRETGELLKLYLRNRGIYDPNAPACVCYGVRPDHSAGRALTNVLNWACKGDKITRMVMIENAGGRMIPWFRSTGVVPPYVNFPLLARKRTGQGGTDIMPVFQAEEIPWRIAAGWDWFSEYVPVETEKRIWIWRDQHLDTYEKVMRRPEDFIHIGRNFRNGFDFIRTGDGNGTEQAKLAVKALGLDFAAVDLLIGKDGLPYILEVNTAPGVIKSGAEPTLMKLAEHIDEWDNAGHPAQ